MGANEGSGSGDVTTSVAGDNMEGSGSGESGSTKKHDKGLDGSNVGRMSKSFRDEVVPVEATEKEPLMSKFAAVDATGSGEASGSGDVTTSQQSKISEPSDGSGVSSGNAGIDNDIKENVPMMSLSTRHITPRTC